MIKWFVVSFIKTIWFFKQFYFIFTCTHVMWISTDETYKYSHLFHCYWKDKTCWHVSSVETHANNHHEYVSSSALYLTLSSDFTRSGSEEQNNCSMSLLMPQSDKFSLLNALVKWFGSLSFEDSSEIKLKEMKIHFLHKI